MMIASARCLVECSESAQRNLRASAWVNIDVLQRPRTLETPASPQDHPILVQLREHGGHLSDRGVVERVIE
jgi:hypothetical protein